MSSSFSASLRSLCLANNIQYPLACVKHSTSEWLINQAISYSKSGAKPIVVPRGSHWQERMQWLMYLGGIPIHRRDYLPFPYTIVSSPQAIDQSPWFFSANVAERISGTGVLPYREALSLFDDRFRKSE